MTSRAGKKRNTTLLAAALSYTAGKLIVAVQFDPHNLNDSDADPLVKKKTWLWHPVDDVLLAAPNNGTKNLQADL